MSLISEGNIMNDELMKFLASIPTKPISKKEMDADMAFISKYNKDHEESSEIIAITYTDLGRAILVFKVNRKDGWIKHPHFLCSNLCDWFGDHIHEVGGFRNQDMESDENGCFAVLKAGS